MKKPFRLLLLIAFVIVVVIGCVFWARRSRVQSALAKYKAELRAQGEKLSWAELGYPRPPETNGSLSQLQTAVERIASGKVEPGLLTLQQYVGPGLARVAWRAGQPPFGTNAPVGIMTWSEFVAVFAAVEPELREIRAALENPPRYFTHDPTNFLNLPRPPLVQLRKTAQWLSADSICALHEQRLDEAQANLHALTQLVQLHREDPLLVSQMIRVAIAGLALADTWEALQAAGWSELQLAALQRDWEGMDMVAGLDRALQGDRALGGWVFGLVDEASQSVEQIIRPDSNVRSRTWESLYSELIVMPIWRANRNEDEMFLLRQYQRSLTAIRELGVAKAWPETLTELNANDAERDAVLGGKMSKFRYLVSGIVIPNTRRAVQTSVHTEIQRCLTVTVIALKRYKLQVGAYPPSLDSLVPQFLSAVPMDLMSAKPLCYHRNSDGTFTLYSAGEDGRDDGGDASTATVTGNWDIWSGRDAVWPLAVKRGD